MKAKEFWFLTMQKNAKAYLQKIYGEEFLCNWQDVQKNIVHENYSVVVKGKIKIVHFMYKNDNQVLVFESVANFHEYEMPKDEEAKK